MYYNYKNNKIYYEKYGNNKKILLILPGWGNNRYTFYNIINYFKDKYTIYIVDYPGFGNSKVINKDLTIFSYSKIIYNFIKDNKINNPIILAHSFGGRISSILIGKYKLKVNKLILIDVAGINRFNLKLYIKTKIYKLINKITKYKYRNKLSKLFSSTDYNNLPNTMKKTFSNIVTTDLRKYYKLIDVETLIIWGEKDKVTPLRDGKLINKLIKNSSLIIYKNRGHFSYYEDYPLTIRILSYIL